MIYSYLILVTFALFQVVFATFMGKNVNILIDRANELTGRGNKILNEHRNQNKAHLLSNVEYQVDRLECFVRMLKERQLENLTSTDLKIHQFEENLLNQENRLAEECNIIAKMYTYNSTGMNINELKMLAAKLVKTIKSKVELHHGHGHREIVPIEYEMIELMMKRLIKQLDTLPRQQTPRLLEEILVRHELSIDNLLNRIQH